MLRPIFLIIHIFYLFYSYPLFSESSFTIETVPNPTKIGKGYLIDTTKKLTTKEIQDLNEKLIY
ncbi:MAG TPA: hypothetical protein PKX55_19930, partial [Leptospiraceae bacterium]|nr:hypothetical protein [Leptospiraceae bacterium]